MWWFRFWNYCKMFFTKEVVEEVSEKKALLKLDTFKGGERGLPNTGETAGHWYYFKDLLNRLDSHFTYIKDLRNSDPEAYNFHSKVGGYVLPGTYGFKEESTDTPAWRAGARPAFGMASWLGEEDTDKRVWCKLGYFLKLKRGQHSFIGEMVVYKVGVYYSHFEEKEHGWARAYYLTIKDDATAKLLKDKVPVSYRLGKGRHAANITRMEWKYPGFPDKCGVKTPQDKSDLIKGLFFDILRAVESASAGLHVRVSKNRVSSLFCIDLLRTPYFFKDRETTVNHNGRKKRIFHIVRTHKRIFKSGKETFVKSHFRGLRKFKWGGYKVVVSMPGKHHPSMLDFDIAATVSDKDEPRRKGNIELGDVGAMLGSLQEGTLERVDGQGRVE